MNNTKDIWFYDLRTNMPNFGKNTSLTEKYFEELERWNKVSIDEVIKKDYSLDLGLIKDETLLDLDKLPNPISNTLEIIDGLKEAISLLDEVIQELKNSGLTEED